MAEQTFLDHSHCQKLLEYPGGEKLISLMHKKFKKENSITGVWSDEENLTYAQFIEDHPFEFQTAEKRRRFKVFQRMAMHLPNRTAIQCRSHNQKMVKLAGDILNVPKYIKKRIQPPGKKVSEQNFVKEEQNEGQNCKFQDKFDLAKNLTEAFQNQKQDVIERLAGLPIKLCIEIRSQNIEQY